MIEYVYFLSDGGARIKIGRTKTLGVRYSQHCTDQKQELEFLGCAEGGSQVERAMHRALQAYRLKGEWFADCKPVRDLIERVKKEGGGFLIPLVEPSIELTGDLARLLDPERMPKALRNLARARLELIQLGEEVRARGFDPVALWGEAWMPTSEFDADIAPYLAELRAGTQALGTQAGEEVK